MIREDKKTIIIVILAIALVIVSFIAFMPSPKPYDKELIEKIISELKSSSDSLLGVISVKNKQYAVYEHKIDSLQTLKPKIVIKYIQDEKSINTASLSVIVHKFDSIFSANHICR